MQFNAISKESSGTRNNKKKNQHEADLGSFPFITLMQKMVKIFFYIQIKKSAEIASQVSLTF